MEAEFIDMTFKYRKTKNVFERVNLINDLIKETAKRKIKWTVNYIVFTTITENNK